MANNKSGIKPIPKEEFIITSSDITQYLQNELGFGIDADYMRWTGVTPAKSYVRMRAVFAGKDIVANKQSTDYVDRVLVENGAGLLFNESFTKTIEPFMFPATTANLLNLPSDDPDIRRLAEYGVIGERLVDIIRFSKLSYLAQNDCFRVYLRPEKIITDMLADPATNKVNGDLVITRVEGVTSESLRWHVEVTNDRSFVGNGINIDAIFENRSV